MPPASAAAVGAPAAHACTLQRRCSAPRPTPHARLLRPPLCSRGCGCGALPARLRGCGRAARPGASSPRPPRASLFDPSALDAFPAELALLGAFGAGIAAGAALVSRDAVLGAVPLPPLPNAVRLSVSSAADKIVTGSGVYVLQHLLNYFYPGLAAVLATTIRRRIQPGLERLQSATLRDVRVEDLTLGDVPPQVNAVKLYDTPAETIIVELETVWDSNARLRLGVSFTEGGSLYAPVEVAGIRFQGVVRVVMGPMLPGPPFVAAMAFASSLAPNIDFKIKVLGGEVSAIPGLREALQEYATSMLNATFLWPTRIVLPFRRARDPTTLQTVLSPEAIDAMRRCDYEALSEPRVRSWGSRGLTRRISKTYGAPGGRPAAPPRRGVAGRALDAVRGVVRYARGKRDEPPAVVAGSASAADASTPASGPASPPAQQEQQQQQAPVPPPVASEQWAEALALKRAQRASGWRLAVRRGSAAAPEVRPSWWRRAWRGLSGRRT